MYYTHLYGEIRKLIILLYRFFDGRPTYGTHTHRLHANKWENKLLSCYLVLVNKVPLVLHSPDMKLYKKRLYSYFHIVNNYSMYAHFEFARS